MTQPDYAVSISVFTEDHSKVARACEVLGRACAGLALDGINATMSVHEMEPDDD